MTSHDEMLEMVAAYALGTLPVADVESVADHLRTCDACMAEYRDLRPLVNALAYSAEACETGEAGPQVSPLLKARVMRAVLAATPGIPRNARLPRVLAACLAVALLGGIAMAWHPWAQHAGVPLGRRYAFAGGTVYVMQGRITIAQHLAPLPKGRVYQVWTLARGARRVAPSVTFSAEHAAVSVPGRAAGLVAVAISVEPAGGSRQPTTTPVAFVRL